MINQNPKLSAFFKNPKNSDTKQSQKWRMLPSLILGTLCSALRGIANASGETAIFRQNASGVRDIPPFFVCAPPLPARGRGRHVLRPSHRLKKMQMPRTRGQLFGTVDKNCPRERDVRWKFTVLKSVHWVASFRKGLACIGGRNNVGISEMSNPVMPRPPQTSKKYSHLSRKNEKHTSFWQVNIIMPNNLNNQFEQKCIPPNLQSPSCTRHGDRKITSQLFPHFPKTWKTPGLFDGF